MIMGTSYRFEMFTKLLVLLSLISVTLAAVAIAPLVPKPEKFKNTPGCYIMELNRVISFGEKVPSKKLCRQYVCNTEYLQIQTCGAVGVASPCKTYADESKPYPDCCPKFKC